VLPARAPAPRRRRRLGCVLALVLLVGAIAGLAVVGMHYLSVVDDIRGVRESSARLADDVSTLGAADLQRNTVDHIRSELDALEERLAPIEDLLADDPLVGLARRLPGAAPQVQAADSLVAAGASLVEAGHIGLGLADRVVALREADDADPEFALMPGLVELMATSGEQVDRVAGLLADARSALDAIPPEAVSQIREARDLVAGPIASYEPLLDTYRELDDVLPRLLGWGDEKRYLVLAQNPAELRPSGGYTGTVGTITLRDGAIVGQDFVDTYDLSVQADLPFVDPPDELTAYLLGEGQSWRLADANWSPDFPTVARKAMEFYGIETGEEDIDGVIAITTYALDRLLEVTGPVDVPEYGVTVQPGEVTMTLLGATRGTAGSIEGRKNVLDALAVETLNRLLSLPPENWEEIVTALEDVGSQRSALVWLADEDAQGLVEDAGWDGRVRQDAGDYLYVVESNVAPTSKYNLVVDRTDTLSVTLDDKGTATNQLRLDWQNRAGEPGEPYASLRSFSISEEGWYGAYLRALTPEGSKLLSARGAVSQRIHGAERVGTEAGRTVFGNDLLMPPGPSKLTYRYRVPGAAVQRDGGWLYELVVQKQPGARPVPVTVEVVLPEGAAVTDLPEGATVDDGTVRLRADLDRDLELRIGYNLPESPPQRQ
jgi:hypothetical protein